MSGSVLSEVITRGGLALQAEDCSIRAAVRHRDEHGGLVRLQNERFYQFIVWRAILPVWHAEVEREGSSDLIVKKENESHYFEMKKWMSATGNKEIPGMKSDVEKLKKCHKCGYLIVFSANPAGQTAKNLAYLQCSVSGLEAAARETAIFDTEDQNGQPIQFWLAGWPISGLGANT